MSLIPAFNRAHDTELAKSHQQVGEGVESLLSSYLHLTGGGGEGALLFHTYRHHLSLGLSKGVLGSEGRGRWALLPSQ